MGIVGIGSRGRGSSIANGSWSIASRCGGIASRCGSIANRCGSIANWRRSVSGRSASKGRKNSDLEEMEKTFRNAWSCF